MINFQFYIPTKIVFGNECISKLSQELKCFGDKGFIITGKESCYKNGILDSIKTNLESHGFEIDIFRGVATNPLEEEIEKGIDAITKIKHDFILTIGGGSVHDFGKAVALGATHKSKIRDYTVLGKESVPGIKNCLIPVITIPTISGTGAEISPASLIRIENRKEIIFSPYMFPRLSLIDPSIMTTAPKELSVKVAFDAFIQSLEAYVSKAANEFSDMFALASIKNCIEYLPLLEKDPFNIKNREVISLAAIQSLFAVAQSGVGAIHALSDPLSGRFNIHHGTALAMLTPYVIEANYESRQERYNQIAKMINDKLPDNIKEIRLNDVINSFLDFQKECGLGDLVKLKKQGVIDSDINSLVRDSYNPDMNTNPKELSEKEIKNIFLQIC